MLTIVLQPYSLSFDLPKDFILSSLPQSLFAEALREDPTATELIIDNPIITPDIMQVLVNSVHGLEPERHNPNLFSAYRYLNIPWLLYYVDPLYDEIPNKTDITDLINTDIWSTALQTNHDLIVGYYLVKGWIPTNEDFLTAVKWGADKVVKILLENAQIDPAVDNNFAIRWAAGQGYLEIVRLLLRDARVNSLDEALRAAARKGQVNVMRLLLADTRVNPAAMHNLAITQAAESGQLEAVRVLLADKRVDPTDRNDNAFRGAAHFGHPEVVRLLLSDPRVNPTAYNNHAIILAAGAGHHEVVRLLLADERVNPAANNNEAIKRAAQNGHLEVVRLLLADARVNPAADNNFALERAIEYNRQDVVDLLKADPRVQAAGF
jgi:ankyrin repeat protein